MFVKKYRKSKVVEEKIRQAFGADFSAVKVHTDGNANQLNRSLHSRAFATGQDILLTNVEVSILLAHLQG